MKKFELTITLSETLTVDEIWPDGDAPENPTALDVRKAFFGDRPHRDILRRADDWGLTDDAELDVNEVGAAPTKPGELAKLFGL